MAEKPHSNPSETRSPSQNNNNNNMHNNADELLDSYLEVDELVSPRYRWVVQRLLGAAFMPPALVRPSEDGADGNAAGAAFQQAALRDKVLRRYGTATARILAYTKWAASPPSVLKPPPPPQSQSQSQSPASSASRVPDAPTIAMHATSRLQASTEFEGLVVQPFGGKFCASASDVTSRPPATV